MKDAISLIITILAIVSWYLGVYSKTENGTKFQLTAIWLMLFAIYMKL